MIHIIKKKIENFMDFKFDFQFFDQIKSQTKFFNF